MLRAARMNLTRCAEQAARGARAVTLCAVRGGFFVRERGEEGLLFEMRRSSAIRHR